jgi:hypothetical protein
MKKSLLEIVQDILSDMGGDEVNSISDTVESSQVAQIVRTTYENMMANRNWPHQKKLAKLTASGNTALPTHMTMEDNVKEIISIKYNCIASGDTKKVYRDVRYVEPDDFLRIVYNRDNTASNVDTIVDPTGAELFIKNDSYPTYLTSFDDVTIVFDSYDSSVESTLQQSKTQVLAYIIPSWTHVDGFTPDLPAEAFPALIEESKNRAFQKIAQRVDQTAAIESRRQQAWLSRKAWRTAGGIKYSSYGRGRVKSARDVTFSQDR